MKIQYLSTTFVRKFLHDDFDGIEKPRASQSDILLTQYFNHDLVLLPFFFDDFEQPEQSSDSHKQIIGKNEDDSDISDRAPKRDKRSVLVSVKVLDN